MALHYLYTMLLHYTHRPPAGVHRTPLRCCGSNLSTVLVLCGDMAGNSASLRDSLALRLVSELPDLRAANVHRRICASANARQRRIPDEKGHAEWRVLFHLGWPDLNRRMRESKSRALPLGDIPILWALLKHNRYILPQSVRKVNRFSEFPIVAADKFSSKSLSPRAPTIHQKFTLQTPRNML